MLIDPKCTTTDCGELRDQTPPAAVSAPEDEKVGLVLAVATGELNEVTKIAHQLSAFYRRI
jgi:hypothetical protein